MYLRAFPFDTQTLQIQMEVPQVGLALSKAKPCRHKP